MAQLDGSDIVYVARVAVPKIIALRVQIGTRFPALQTSQGKVLLAALDPDALARGAGRAEPVRPAAVPGRDRPPTIAEELTTVRARGWALADEELAPGVRSVAVPVRDGDGAVRAAMNVTVHAAETSVDDPDRRPPAAAAARRPARSAPTGRCGSPGRTPRSTGAASRRPGARPRDLA